MTSIERIVRPFVSRDVTPPVRLFNPTATPSDDILLEIGKVGATKTFNGSASASRSAYTETKHREVSRTVVPVRIENPDDSEQHVNVDVVTKLTTVDKTGEKTTKAETILAKIPDDMKVEGGPKVIDSSGGNDWGGG